MNTLRLSNFKVPGYSTPTMRLTAVTGVVLIAGMLSVSQGQIVMLSGTHYLQTDTPGQTIEVRVFNPEVAGSSVDALNFVAQVGDGGPAYGGTAAPVITSVDLHTGTSFDLNYLNEVDQESTPQFAQLYIQTASGTVTLPYGESKLATLTIDTTGFNTIGQSWDFNLAFISPPGSTPIPGSYVMGGIDIDTTFQAGSLTLVPEPNAMWVVAPALVGVAFAWKRRSVS